MSSEETVGEDRGGLTLEAVDDPWAPPAGEESPEALLSECADLRNTQAWERFLRRFSPLIVATVVRTIRGLNRRRNLSQAWVLRRSAHSLSKASGDSSPAGGAHGSSTASRVSPPRSSPTVSSLDMCAIQNNDSAGLFPFARAEIFLNQTLQARQSALYALDG